MLQKRGEPAMKNITIGMDLGDKNHVVCVLNAEGDIVTETNIKNDRESIKTLFGKYKNATVAIEASTHSPWISRQLASLGCEVLVGNPRKLRVIWDSDDKTDKRDAKMLAQIARFDPKLLYPITHRGKQAQIDLEILQARDNLVKNRTNLINHVRGSVKAQGERLLSCGAASFHNKVEGAMPDFLKETLTPMVEIIGRLTEQIKEYDRKIEQISKEQYPETELLRAIKGVGSVTALAFVLILEDPERFSKSRQVGSFLGLTPRRDQSGEIDKQLRITKAGNPFLRRLLVGAAQYIMGPFGEDCDLRRFGLRLSGRGGKNAKRRAVVAVARKLAVLLHRLWQHGEMYEPIHSNSKSNLAKAA